MRGLVEKDPQASRGNVYAYRTSAAFLSHMGLSKISELPEYGSYREKFEVFQNASVDQKTKQDSAQL
jgi:chromosome segregation and condensation protein ScpB